MKCRCFGGPLDGDDIETSAQFYEHAVLICEDVYYDGHTELVFGKVRYERHGDVLLYITEPKELIP